MLNLFGGKLLNAMDGLSIQSESRNLEEEYENIIKELQVLIILIS